VRIAAATLALAALAALPLTGCLLTLAKHPLSADALLTKGSPDQLAGSAALLLATGVAAWLLLAVTATVPAAWREAVDAARRGASLRPTNTPPSDGNSPAASLRRLVIAAVTLAAVGGVGALPASATDAVPTPATSRHARVATWPDTSWSPTPAPARPAPAPEFRVRPGDTLWAIAAAHLPSTAGPAEIDRAWRAWYALNRPRIGDDPDLLRPGMRLLVPRTPGVPRR
jgi:nucleoid-associated protein YgaU